jgi:GT2 family glycosyltransferase
MSEASQTLSAVAILSEAAERLPDVLVSVRAQAAPFASITVVGGGSAARRAAEAADVPWISESAGLKETLPDAVTHVWFLHDDSQPRPDALLNLVEESMRVDASVAGSKLVDFDDPNVLESIGGATDLLCYPVSGLDVEEVDQGQYDLIRDVAFIPSASVLIRKDLFAGLGGIDPMMAPVAAGIDFSQRARLAGGRVVVVPSSEVLHRHLCSDGIPRWREQAGEMRALLKSYSLLTLLWIAPLAVVVWTLAALMRTLTGHPIALVDLAKSALWNIKNLGSLVRGRSQLRKARHLGDEELFRYQSRGFESFKQAWLGVLNPLRARVAATGESQARIEERSTSKTLAITAALGLVWMVLFRSLMFGDLPTAQWSLPLADLRDTLRVITGGWNGAGFGTNSPPHPSASVLAVFQSVLGSRAATRITMLAGVVGLFGAFRLFRRLELGEWASVGGAVVMIGGPATALLGGSGNWQGLVALGAVPWMSLLVLAPRSKSWMAMLSRVGGLGLASGILAGFAPLTVALPAAVGVLGFLFYNRLSSLVWGALGTVFSVPFVLAWGGANSFSTLLDAGTGMYWKPTLIFVSAASVSWLLGLVSPQTTWRVSVMGGVIAAAGVVGLRGYPGSREVAVASALTLALGLGSIAAAAFSAGGLSNRGVGRALGSVALMATFVLLVAGAGPAWNGSLGLSSDDSLEDLRAFMEARETAPDSRVLLVNAAAPGDSREWDGGEYRVFDTGLTYLDAFLGPDGDLDVRLSDDLAGYVEDPQLRATSLFLPYGLQWIALPVNSPLLPAFQGRLDLVEIGIGDLVVFELEKPIGPATASSGYFWRIDAASATGRSSDSVDLVINQTVRFPDSSDQLGAQVDGTRGEVAVIVDRRQRLLSQLVAGWAGLLLVMLVVGRIRR